MANWYAQYPASSSGNNQSVGVNGNPIPLDSTLIGGKDGSGNLIPVSVDSSGNVNANVSSSVLPTGAATAANQTTEITKLTSLDSKLASSDIHVAYDYRAFTYVGATTKIDTITYKTGGSGGTTVATQTFAYDGSDRITSITTT